MDHGSVKRDNYQIPEGLWTKTRNLILVVGALAWILTLIGAFTDPKQFYFSYLTAFWYWTVIGLGAAFWMMVQFVSGAAASATVRRIMENVAAGVPYAALLFIPVALGVHVIYTWADPVIASHDPVLLDRGLYFNPIVFVIRSYIFIAILSVFVLKVCQHAAKIDSAKSIVGGLAESKWAERWAAPGIIVLMIIGTFFAWEWIMSLDARSFSTIFGVYCIANGGLGAMAVFVLMALWLRRNGVLENTINIEHYHDLGKWLFTTTIFWAYAAFAQYMLIWYANIPEETQYFFHRYQGAWYNVGVILIFGHFLFPFLFLIGRYVKRHLATLGFAGIYALVICYIDVYWMVMPMLHKDTIHVHWLDLTTILAVASVYGFVFWNRMKKYALVPVGDIRLVQSLAFKNQ
jgi:hypothetical protein